ncbi:carbohydrate ABC transporter permease [Paenibacillus marinisediminis]
MTGRRTLMKSGYVFDFVNYSLLILLCVVTIYPFLYLLTLSLTSGDVSLTQLNIIPKKVTFLSYEKVLTNEYVANGFVRTLTRTIIGTIVTVVAMVLTAYPLAKKQFPHRGFWTMFIVFTMFFSGGLIPNYFLVKNLGLMNTIWALILPGMIHTFQMLIARNFFMTLPEALEESAKIDGANDITVLIRIVFPLSMPIIATLTLWSAVGHWNAWFDSLIYITDSHQQVLQVVLRRIVLEGTKQMMDLGAYNDENIIANPETIKAATVMVATIPILLVYPFVQKHFVKGIIVGSLKG